LKNPEIKVFFSDFWSDFNVSDNFICEILSLNYSLILDPNPEYLFFSSYGNEHLNYDCIKIYYTPENLVPDFNLCDYAIGSHFLNFQDRYLRMPFFATKDAYKKTALKNFDNEKVLNRKFCNFVFSNSEYADPVRNRFYELLSRYKKVDSGGLLYNNIGGQVNNKIEFISGYKFTIAFENSTVDGYTTEKIVEPMSVNSIPVYWGNPLIGTDFNDESFISLKDSNDIALKEVIDRIIYLDNNDEAYIDLLSKPWMKPGQYVIYEQVLFSFLMNIFRQPYEKAFRRAKYGYNMGYTKTISRMVASEEKYRYNNIHYFRFFIRKIGKSILKTRRLYSQDIKETVR
jgi:hypothetical protein